MLSHFYCWRQCFRSEFFLNARVHFLSDQTRCSQFVSWQTGPFKSAAKKRGAERGKGWTSLTCIHNLWPSSSSLLPSSLLFFLSLQPLLLFYFPKEEEKKTGREWRKGGEEKKILGTRQDWTHTHAHTKGQPELLIHLLLKVRFLRKSLIGGGGRGKG